MVQLLILWKIWANLRILSLTLLTDLNWTTNENEEALDSYLMVVWNFSEVLIHGLISKLQVSRQAHNHLDQLAII